MRKWLGRIDGHGCDVDSTKLTNQRFADDILLCAKSHDSAKYMLTVLIEELQAVGLQLNEKKTKVPTTGPTTGVHIQILGPKCSHKWLGRMLCTNAQQPFRDGIEGRLTAVNRACYKHRGVSCCRAIPLASRLKLFQSYVSPVVCYAAGSKPLTQADAKRLDVAFRRYMRQVVGFPKLTGNAPGMRYCILCTRR